jgi:ribonuclease PH
MIISQRKIPRKIEITLLNESYAEGAIVLKAGKTHIHCTASIEDNVPNWLKGKHMGWIQAEYSLLPRSTHTRTKRERDKLSGRTMEIQRLIGRSLRQMLNLEHLGERSLIVDCDVLQADGGTRTMSINAASIAVYIAIHQLIKKNILPNSVFRNLVAAISVGIFNHDICVDLDYEMDSKATVDANFVFTESSECIEVQATGEKSPFNKAQFDTMYALADNTCQAIIKQQWSFLNNL